MGNVIRVVIYLGLLGVGGRYGYQHYQGQQRIKQLHTQTGDNFLNQVSQQLSGIEQGSEENPFGSTYITLPQPRLGNNNTCTTPWGKAIEGGDYTLAFESNQARTSDNVCVLEKRICSEGLLGGSYDQHTCYFMSGSQGKYEYLGIIGNDTTQLVRDAEAKLGISEQSYTYEDNASGVGDYALIDQSNTPSGRTNNGGYTNPSQQTQEGSSTDLGPIIARTPEQKINQQQEQKINPNGNGVQGDPTPNQYNPGKSYSTNTVKIDQSGSTTPSRVSCRTPWGTEVFHNQHVLAFQSSEVAAGQSCKSELRTCTQGYLRGSYQHETCTIAGSNNTRSYWYYPSTRYNNSYNNYDYDTNYQYYDRQYYNNYDYEDWYYDRYHYSYKAPYKPYQSCVVDSYGFVGHGSTITLYEKSQVGPGESCRSSIRTCNDGTLTGPTSYTYASCKVSSTSGPSKPSKNTQTVNNGGSTTAPYGNNRSYRSCYDIRFGNINHGSSVKMYKNASVPYGMSCEYEYRTCNDGTLVGSYQNETCTVRDGSYRGPRYEGVNVYRYTPYENDNWYYVRPYRYGESCTIPNYGILEHGSSLMMYASYRPQKGFSCDGTLRSCVNGVLTGPETFNATRCKTQ